MNKEFSLLDSLKVLGRWKKHILLTTGAVAILSIIGSLMMPNYYQASAIIYAAHPDLAKPDPVGEMTESRFVYGTSDDMDRLLSVANSSEIRNYLVDKFSLYGHYKIDSSTVKGPAKLAKKFGKLFKTTRTKYDAMDLSMEDVDPKMAKNIVTAARERLSENMQNIMKSSQKKTLETTLSNITEQDKALQQLNDSLMTLKKKYGIYDSNTQGEVYAQMLTSTTSLLFEQNAKLSSMQRIGMKRDSIRKVQAQIAGLESKKANLETSVDNYTQGILPVRVLEQGQRRISEELSLAKERYKRLKSSYDSPFTALHIVETEAVPVEKSRPKRSILVLGFTLMAFLLSCLGAIVVDSTKDINWKEIYNG